MWMMVLLALKTHSELTEWRALEVGRRCDLEDWQACCRTKIWSLNILIDILITTMMNKNLQ